MFSRKKEKEPKEKKIQIIRKLCNMNALILADDLVEDEEYE